MSGRFNFTEITKQSRADITDVMDNFTKIEESAATSAELTSAVSTLNTTINNKETALKAVATTSANGMMSKEDKSKLDGVANGANNYTLPTAGSGLGGVKTTSAVSDVSTYTPCPIVGGIPYFKDTNTTYSNSTTSTDGLMSSTDKSKLDGIAANANNYSLPTASSSLGGVKTTSTVTSNSGYTACPIISGVPYYKDTNTTYSNATTSAAGLMSATDKSKLNGIAANANNYSLPTASSTLGGVKTTSTVTSNSGYTACPIISGVPYYKDTNTTYSNATTSAAGLMSSTDKTKLDGIAIGANKTTVTDNLTSTSTSNALSANQGKVLKDLVDAKQKTITYGTAAPSGGSNGDIYIQYFT